MDKSMANLNEVFLIPPIFDAIVDHLSAIDLLRLRRTNRSIHEALKNSRSAWRALSFTTLKPATPCACHQRLRGVSGSSYSNLITSRSHFGGAGDSSGDGATRRRRNGCHTHEIGTGKSAYLSVDKVLTFIGRTLRLNMYTSLDLSRTMADASLVRNLLDNCPGLVYLGLAECPNLARAYDLMIAMYGLEKSFLKEYRAQRVRDNAKLLENRKFGSSSGGAAAASSTKRKLPREKIETNSVVVEFMSRPKIEGDPDSKFYANNIDYWSEEGSSADDEAESDSARARTPAEQAETVSRSNNSSLALPVSVQNELIRMQELTRCLNWSELDALLDNDLIEDAYIAPDLPPSPPTLEKRPFKLRHITMNINLTAAKPPMQSWLYTALWKPETYLFLMGYVMGIKIDCPCDNPM